MKISLLICFLIASFPAEKPFRYAGYETDDSFKTGQILYPDYVHQDTRIVTDGDSLTYYIQSPDGPASDGELSAVITYFSKPIN